MAITYSISGGADAAKFNIDATSGALTFKVAPDFEKPGDANADNKYEVIVQATDATGLSSTKPVTVTVTDVSEGSPPQITSAGAISVKENQLVVMTITATDPDDGTVPPIEPPTGGNVTTGDYYVATNGSDSNNGTSVNSPFKTIEKAASVVSAGKTVLVKAGTYSPNTIYFGNHGTAAAPIKFLPYGTDKPVIDGANTSANVAMVQMNANYTILGPGFVLQNSKANGIAFWQAVGSQVIGNTVKGCTGAGIYCTGPAGGPQKDCIIKDNIVFNNSLMNKDHALNNQGGWGMGITVQRADNCLVEGNHVYENWGEGIGTFEQNGAKVRNNIVHDNYSIQVYPDNAPNTEVSGNLVYWSGDKKWSWDGTDKPDGIRMCRETNVNANDNIRIFNNIVVATSNGVASMEYGAGGGCQNCKVYNNTLVNCGIQFEGGGNNRGNEFKNNIISGGYGSYGPNTGWACSNNNWNGNSAGNFAGSGDVNAAPGFVGTAGALDANAYKLNANSPCKQKGMNFKSVVAKDYAKVDRPASGNFTIGGYE
jgi:parallel beta-helix repeat protein